MKHSVELKNEGDRINNSRRDVNRFETAHVDSWSVGEKGKILLKIRVRM